MFLGFDFGTSAVKALLVDENQHPVASAQVPLSIQRPAPGHSEQDPADWWAALESTLDTLQRDHPAALSAVQAIGLAGQQHGAVVLDAAGHVLRPAILWNDVRATAECAEIERRFPQSRTVTGNPAMPGFTAPKLLWLQHHEPDLFARIATVLLPKAYIRYRLTGDLIEDLSDASGTLWLDVARRTWSDDALATTGLTGRHMPALIEGNAAAGRLRPSLAARWGFAHRPILAGGAGDNAAGAIGLGAITPGQAFVSLGTSGVLFAVTDGYRANPGAAVHSFCHALPDTWHQMGVTLSAAGSLAWWAGVTGQPESKLLAEMGTPTTPSPATFLPYLGGERTPHNDGTLRGVFAGLSHETARPQLTQAVLEGVAFSLRDCLDALAASGTAVTTLDAIGGGTRSPAWLHILAAALNRPLRSLQGGEHGGAFGAARLARMAATKESPASVCTAPDPLGHIQPDPALAAAYDERLQTYRALAGSAAFTKPRSPD